MRKQVLKQTTGLQHLVRPEQRTKITPHFVRSKREHTNFQSFSPIVFYLAKLNAEPSKFTVFEIDCEEAKKLQQKRFIL